MKTLRLVLMTLVITCIGLGSAGFAKETTDVSKNMADRQASQTVKVAKAYTEQEKSDYAKIDSTRIERHRQEDRSIESPSQRAQGLKALKKINAAIAALRRKSRTLLQRSSKKSALPRKHNGRM